MFITCVYNITYVDDKVDDSYAHMKIPQGNCII